MVSFTIFWATHQGRTSTSAAESSSSLLPWLTAWSSSSKERDISCSSRFWEERQGRRYDDEESDKEPGCKRPGLEHQYHVNKDNDEADKDTTASLLFCRRIIIPLWPRAPGLPAHYDLSSFSRDACHAQGRTLMVFRFHGHPENLLTLTDLAL